MKSILIFFSRANENYAVGNLKVVNTEVLAKRIKKLINEVNPKMNTLQKSQKTGIVNDSCFFVSLNCKRQSILLPMGMRIFFWTNTDYNLT